MKKNKAYEDSLGSIFDFIFTEAKKDPGKVKPVKVSGVSSTDAYADAITSVLENPLLFVNNTTKDAFKDLMDVNLTKVDLGRKEEVAIKGSDILKVLNNDMSFIDDRFKKLESQRKMGRLTWAGNEIAGLIASNWAKDNDLDFDTQMAMMTAGKKDSAGHENVTTVARGKALAKEHFNNPKNILTKQQYVSRYSSSFSPTRGKSADDQAREQFKTYRGWQRKYEEAEAQRALTGKGPTGIEALGDVAESAEFYAFMERDNLTRKAYEARQKGENEKAEKLIKSAGFVEALNNKDSLEKYKDREKQTLRNYATRIEALAKAGPIRNKAQIDSLRTKMVRIDKNLRALDMTRNAMRLGELEGAISSVKGVWEYTVGGQLIPAIISGDFFDPRKNNIFEGKFVPVKQQSFGLGVLDDKGVEQSIKINVAKGRGGAMGRYDQVMTDIYYLTPGSLVKTLYTGEGFAYRALRQRDKFLKGDIAKRYGNIEFTKLFGVDGETYLTSIAGSMSPEDLARVTKFLKKNKGLQKLAYNFGFIDRTKKQVTDFISKKVLGKSLEQVRETVGKWLLDKLGKSELAKQILGEWIKKGGFKVLLQSVRVAVKEAVKVFLDGVSAGITRVLGPVVDFIVDKVIDLAIKVGEKVVKPVLKATTQVLVFCCAGCFGCFGVIVLVVGTLFGKFSHITPGDVKECSPNFTVEAPPGGVLGIPFEGEPLPDGVTCLYGPQPTRCTQGPGGSYSHGNLIAIDVADLSYFYTPTFCDEGLGNCVLISTRPYPCGSHAGDEVVFTAEYGGHSYKFILVHTKLNDQYSPGDLLGPGIPIGRIQEYAETYTCSTGKHLHLELEYDGSKVNPQNVMTADPSDGGFGCQTSSCP